MTRFPSGLSVKAHTPPSAIMMSSPKATKPTEAAQASAQSSSQSAHPWTNTQQQAAAGQSSQPSAQTTTASPVPPRPSDAWTIGEKQHGKDGAIASEGGMTQAQQSAAVLAKWGMPPSPQLQQQLQQEQLQQAQLQSQQQQQQRQEQEVQQQQPDSSDVGNDDLNLKAGDTVGTASCEADMQAVGCDDVGLTLEQPDGESRPPMVAPEVVRGRVVRATEKWHKQLSQQDAQQQVVETTISSMHQHAQWLFAYILWGFNNNRHSTQNIATPLAATQHIS